MRLTADQDRRYANVQLRWIDVVILEGMDSKAEPAASTVDSVGLEASLIAEEAGRLGLVLSLRLLRPDWGLSQRTPQHRC